VPDQVRLHSAENRLGRFAAAAHLAESDDPVICLDLDDCAHESSPMAAVRMPQRRLERDGHGSGADIYDFHSIT
jgi:hypothetical protein